MHDARHTIHNNTHDTTLLVDWRGSRPVRIHAAGTAHTTKLAKFLENEHHGTPTFAKGMLLLKVCHLWARDARLHGFKLLGGPRTPVIAIRCFEHLVE